MPFTGFYISDSDITNWPSGTTDAEKQAVIETAEAIVEAALKVHYRPLAFDVRLNGNAQNRIFLPLTANILTVTLVQVHGLTVDSADYTFDKNSVFINVGSGASDVEVSYLLDQFASGSLFPRGYNNIRIRGTYGASVVPAWIKEVCKIVASDHNDPSLYTHYLASESIGGYSYSITSELAGLTGMTGIKEADDVIKLFRRKKGMFMAP
jgi:hypothetical protein